MYGSGIFVFGTKIFHEETKRDPISALPMEMSWKIFSYLNGSSLRSANRTHKTWSRIIQANKKLRNRLYKYELPLSLKASWTRIVKQDRQLKMETERMRVKIEGRSTNQKAEFEKKWGGYIYQTKAIQDLFLLK